MKCLKILCISLFAVLLMSGCEEQYKGEALKVTLGTSTSYAHVYAELSCDKDETFEVGVCYSKTSNPSLYSAQMVYQYVIHQSYYSIISADFYYSEMNLSKNTTYYMRGYIKNNSGIIYSEQEKYTYK